MRKGEIVSLSGKRQYEVYAYLQDELVPNRCFHQLYGSADGTGSDCSLMIAAYKAISESLERWAFYSSKKIGGVEYGFDIDRSSSGMAAFPGLFKKNTRKLALLESVERWALRHWWEGFLNHNIQDNDSYLVLRINVPWKKIKVIVLANKVENFFSYGFAAGFSIDEAFQKAQVELERNIRVLKKFYQKNNEAPLVSSVDENLFERRLIFFSSDDGERRFLDRVSTSPKSCDLWKNPPTYLLDKEIIGPWTRYATVWRIVFSGCANEYMKSDPGYFFF